MENFSQIKVNCKIKLIIWTSLHKSRLHYFIKGNDDFFSLFVFLTMVFSFSLKKNNYLFLAMLGLCCCSDFSLAVESRGYSPVAVHRLLIAVASLVAELRL